MRLSMFAVGRGGRKYTDGSVSIDEEGEVVGGIVYVQKTTGSKARDTRCQCLAC